MINRARQHGYIHVHLLHALVCELNVLLPYVVSYYKMVVEWY